MNISDVNVGINESSPFMNPNLGDGGGGMDPFYHFKSVLVRKI